MNFFSQNWFNTKLIEPPELYKQQSNYHEAQNINY